MTLIFHQLVQLKVWGCGGNFNDDFVENLVPSVPAKGFENWSLFDEVIIRTCWLCFGPLYA